MSGRTVAIIQARMGSSRLPGKVLMEVAGQSLLGFLTRRLKFAESLDEIVVATTTHSRDDILVREAEALGLRWFRGSEEDVLGRYVQAAAAFDAQTVVRVTADNPMTDFCSIDRVVSRIQAGAEYAIETDLPVGTTGEALAFETLVFLDVVSTTARLREHVTLFAKENPLSLGCSLDSGPDGCRRPDLSFTVDRMEEYLMVKDLCEAMPGPHFLLKELIAVADKRTVAV